MEASNGGGETCTLQSDGGVVVSWVILGVGGGWRRTQQTQA